MSAQPMTAEQRAAHVHALLHGAESVLVCWAPAANASAPMCGGRVTWVPDGDGFRSSCSRCNATGLSASGEKSNLQRLFGSHDYGPALDTPAEL